MYHPLNQRSILLKYDIILFLLLISTTFREFGIFDRYNKDTIQCKKQNQKEHNIKIPDSILT